ncbi:MAG: hypothetical protein PVI23_07395 [Maricaulaceae bacterium]|jgi:hypothetical protein
MFTPREDHPDTLEEARAEACRLHAHVPPHNKESRSQARALLERWEALRPETRALVNWAVNDMWQRADEPPLDLGEPLEFATYVEEGEPARNRGRRLFLRAVGQSTKLGVLGASPPLYAMR